VTTKTASELGRSNRNRGATAERELVKWLRDNGWPGAERAVRTGYRTADRVSADPGDVTGTPGLVWQMKYTTRFEEPAVFAANLAETEAQRAAAGADHGLLVQRRAGTADVGKWWVHVTGQSFAVLLTGQPAPTFGCVARVTLAEFALLLRRAGYGTPLQDPAVA
jgi:hypothetical protein